MQRRCSARDGKPAGVRLGIQDGTPIRWTSGAQDGTILDYALTTSNSISEHRSDGEVAAIPNTFEEAMEAPQAAKWKEAADKEMASLEKHEVFD